MRAATRRFLVLLLPWMLLPISATASALAWRIDGASEAEEAVFGELRDILRLRDGRTALLDSQLGVVRLFREDGSFEQEVACEGEGPGEVENPVALVQFPKERLSVVQARPPKLALLALDGESADDWIPPTLEGRTDVSIIGASSGDGILVLKIYTSTISKDGTSEHAALCRWADDFTQPVLLLERSNETGSSNPVAREFGPLDELEVWAIDSRGRLLIATRPDEFKIRILDPAGAAVREDVWPEYKRQERAESRYNAIAKRYEAMVKYVPGVTEFDVAKFERDVQRILPTPSGGYYTLSSREVFGREASKSVNFAYWTSDGSRGEDIEVNVNYRRDCDLLWVSRDHLYIVYGGRSASQAARRTSDMAKEILGSDPCARSDGYRDMTIECFRMLPESR